MKHPVYETKELLEAWYRLAEEEEDLRLLLRRCFRDIEAEFAKQNLILVNSVLGAIELAKLPNSVLVAISRATSRAQLMLPLWKDYTSRVAAHLKNAGEDVAVQMRGLIEHLDKKRRPTWEEALDFAETLFDDAYKIERGGEQVSNQYWIDYAHVRASEGEYLQAAAILYRLEDLERGVTLKTEELRISPPPQKVQAFTLPGPICCPACHSPMSQELDPGEGGAKRPRSMTLKCKHPGCANRAHYRYKLSRVELEILPTQFVVRELDGLAAINTRGGY